MKRSGLLVVAVVLAAGCGASGYGQPPNVGQGIEARLDEASRRLAADPGNARLLVERARLFHEMLRWDDMIRDLDRAIQITPHDPTALAMRGLARGAIQRYDDALEDIDAALTIRPDWAGLLAVRGSVLLNMGKLDDAVEWLTRSIEALPGSQAYYDRAFCHHQRGERAKAIDDYTAAFKLDPGLVAAICERGQVYQEQGEFDRAIDDLEYCRRQRPDDPRASLALAWILATCPDPARRSGHKALLIARDLCDPVTCQVIEPLTALAAAYAEVGEFPKAEALQKRAVALSYFAPPFHEACVRRLDVIQKHEPIREASTPLVILPRLVQDSPRVVTYDEAFSAPADVLATNYISTRHLQSLCPLASAGATINQWLDGRPIVVSAANAARVAERLQERMMTFTQVIYRRGFVRLEPGYTSAREGGCQEWGIGEMPVLIEQNGCDLHLSQGNMRHLGVVIESTVAFRHEANTDIIITGRVSGGGVVFATPQQGGIDGSAVQRCVWRLTPAVVEGPEWAASFLGRALAHRTYHEYAAMIADLDRSMQLKPDAEVAGLEAYFLATCPDEEVRDGARAVERAEQARALAGDAMNEGLFISLAVAHAEAGNFDTAAMYQRKVIELVADEEKPWQRERLEMFESGRPFHEDRLQE